LSEIPFPERRTINILVAYWRLWHSKSPDRVTPTPTVFELIAGCSVGNAFFIQVYRDLRSGSSGKYANYTELDFKKFLEAEYRQPLQISEEDQDLCFAEVPIEIGPKHKKYENICWRCYSHISSDELKRCLECGWYICGNCGSCKRDCNRIYTPFVNNAADGPFLPDFPDE
jgi:hypothetical protein